MRGQGQHLVEGWLGLKCPTKTGLLSFSSTSFHAPVRIHLWHAVVLCVYLHIWPLEILEFRKSFVRSPLSQTFFDNIARHHQLIAHVSQWVKAAYVWVKWTAYYQHYKHVVGNLSRSTPKFRTDRSKKKVIVPGGNAAIIILYNSVFLTFWSIILSTSLKF